MLIETDGDSVQVFELVAAPTQPLTQYHRREFLTPPLDMLVSGRSAGDIWRAIEQAVAAAKTETVMAKSKRLADK